MNKCTDMLKVSFVHSLASSTVKNRNTHRLSSAFVVLVWLESRKPVFIFVYYNRIRNVNKFLLTFYFTSYIKSEKSQLTSFCNQT